MSIQREERKDNNSQPPGKRGERKKYEIRSIKHINLNCSRKLRTGRNQLGSGEKLVSENEIDSAVGHASTAQIMTALLGVEIPVNRQMFAQQPGQDALVFKLNGRPQEGKILTAEEIEQIGYKFQLLRRTK